MTLSVVLNGTALRGDERLCARTPIPISFQAPESEISMSSGVSLRAGQ